MFQRYTASDYIKITEKMNEADQMIKNIMILSLSILIVYIQTVLYNWYITE